MSRGKCQLNGRVRHRGLGDSSQLQCKSRIAIIGFTGRFAQTLDSRFSSTTIQLKRSTNQTLLCPQFSAELCLTQQNSNTTSFVAEEPTHRQKPLIAFISQSPNQELIRQSAILIHCKIATWSHSNSSLVIAKVQADASTDHPTTKEPTPGPITN